MRLTRPCGTFPDSKHEGERVALQAANRHGIELVVVNPAHALGVAVDSSHTRANSSRIIGNYLRGRLPAVIAAPMNFVDVEDAAAGHLLAADCGRPGERYILGGTNATWPALIDRVAQLSDVHHPVVVLPRETARVARLGDTLGVPELISVGSGISSQVVRSRTHTARPSRPWPPERGRSAGWESSSRSTSASGWSVAV